MSDVEQIKYQISDHFDGVRFKNKNGAISKSFQDLLRWKLFHRPAKWPSYVENKCIPTLVDAKQVLANKVFLTFINHVTFLVQCNSLNILTDPVFAMRTSPSQLIGPKRVRKPGLTLEQLPKIDVILLSHNHYDHMDLHSLKYLCDRDQAIILTPIGNLQVLRKAKIINVVEKDWWETFDFHYGTQFITTPAHHWSGRGLLDRNRALWSGFVVKTPRCKIFFAGDSGYASHFLEIRDRLGPMDISLLPIGAYEPRWFMCDQHMNPEEAVKAHIDLRSGQSIGTHFGTFQLTDEEFEAPVADLKKACDKFRIENFTVLEVGETRRIETK